MSATQSSPSLMRVEELDGPAGIPLLGNALQLKPGFMHLQLEQWAREFGSRYRIRIGRSSLLVLTDHALALQALKDRPDGFRRLANFEPIFIEMGANGVFSAEGEHWRHQRRMWLASLNAQQIRGFHDGVKTITGRLLARWNKAADDGVTLHIIDDFMRYTVDMTVLFAFGQDANTLEQGEDVIQKHMGHVFPGLARRIAAPVPYWRWIKFKKDRELDAALKALREEAGVIIATARKRLESSPELRESPSCFLEAMLVASENDEQRLTDEDVFANCLTALLAGEDTTANTLSWMTHYFTQHPDWYSRARAEADELLGDATLADPQNLPAQLPVIDACINETLRIRPASPLIFLTAAQDRQLGDLEIPEGTHMVLLLREAVGCAPGSIPPKPFDPASIMNVDGGLGKIPSLPFGFGPRLCPGRNLALAELRSAMLMLAKNFDLEAVPGPIPVRERFSFTLIPDFLNVRLSRRQSLTTA